MTNLIDLIDTVKNQNNLTKAKNLIKDGLAKINMTDTCNNTPLHVAALNGHLDICVLLINYGANVHAKNNSGYTAEDLAIKNNEKEISDFLFRTKIRSNRGFKNNEERQKYYQIITENWEKENLQN